jgi:hypothetical protein
MAFMRLPFAIRSDDVKRLQAERFRKRAIEISFSIDAARSSHCISRVERTTMNDPEPGPVGRWNRLRPLVSRRHAWKIVLGVIFLYIGVAYLLLPGAWDEYERLHPALKYAPGVTHTTVGIPADPINVAIVGSKKELITAMLAAKWYPADALSLKSSIEIAADTVFRRPYDEAPVSSLYLFGRKEDLAFEKPVGDDPKQRNHVRFWQAEKLDANGTPLWLGSASYDKGVGLSHTTGEVTHHIAANVDVERDRLVKDLESTGDVVKTAVLPNFHKIKEGRNGGGDPWITDGALDVCVLKSAGK